MPAQDAARDDGRAPVVEASEPMPLQGDPRFAEGEVFAISINVEVCAIFPDGTRRLRTLRPWGGYRYWDCGVDELRVVTKP